MIRELQVSTVAGWSYVFYRTWDGTSVISLAYFVGIIMFVLIIMNLFLAGADLHSTVPECEHLQ